MSQVDSRTKQTKRIAIAIEMDHGYPWHQDCYQGILEYAQECDWLCVVDPFLVGMGGRSDITDYDGVVGRIDSTIAQAAQWHGIPVVNHWGNSPVRDLPSVDLDNIGAGRLSGEHLVSCGYQRFAYAGIRENRAGDHEVEGLTQAVMAKGFGKPDVWECSGDFESDREKITRFRQRLNDWLAGLTVPIGIVAHHMTVARYLAQIAYERGWKVPEDLGIVVQTGDLSTATASPSITLVAHDFRRLGYEAAQLLDELMDGNAAHPLRRIIAPQKLIVRESTDVFVCADPLVSDAMRYIAEHCREALRVEEVAEAIDTSQRTLERRFEQFVGRTVYAEITRLRIESIKRLLIESDISLAKVADLCGFSNPGYFASYFRKEVGITPSVYRKQQRQEAKA